MSLKENCRNRIFSIVSKITEKSKYVIMIVDGNAYRVLSFVCKNEELLERGVSLIELINTNRSSLKDFDCIYFLSSNIQSVDFMLKDFPNEKEAKYKNVHILFTSAIGKNSKIIELIANNDYILKKIKSCASINMDFLAYESRSFYFEHITNLYDLYPLKNAECLFEISSKLISVCSCLNITRPFIRYQNSNLCRKFAEIFYNGICNTFINNNNNYNNNTDMSNLKNHLLNTWFLQYCNYLKLTNQVIPRNLNSLILEEKEKNASYSYTNADDVDIRGEVVPFLRESAESVDDTNTFQNQQEFRNTIPYQSITKTHGFDEQIKKSLQLYDKKPEEKNHLMQIATQNSTSAQPRNDDYEMDINVFIQILKRKVEDMKGNEVDHKVPFQQRPIHTSVQKDKTSMNLMIEPQKMYHPSVPSFNVDGWVSNTQNQQTHEKDHQRVLPNTYERHSSMERIGNVLTTQRDSRNVCNVETNRYSNRKKNKTENPIRKTTSRKNANGRVNKKDGRDGNDGTIKEGEKGNAVYEIEATKHMNKSSQ